MSPPYRLNSPPYRLALHSSLLEMDLANERLHAAAKSGDVEQLQVTWSDQVIPRRAADARSSGRAAFGAAAVGNRGRGYAPRRVRPSTRAGRRLEDADGGSASAPQHWRTAHALASFSVESGPRRVLSAQQSSPRATVGCILREGRTALALAAVAGHSPVVALLIDAGADLNVKSNEG